MKKVTAIESNSSKESFKFWEDEQLIADISFNQQTRFVRVVSKLGKRMFSFEKRGFLHPKKVIRNEYGIKLGNLDELKPGAGKGTVELEGKKYIYVYDRNNTGELTLYDEAMQKNLFTCSMNALAFGINKTKSLLDTKFASLLLLLCWYTLQSHHQTSVSGMVKDI